MAKKSDWEVRYNSSIATVASLEGRLAAAIQNITILEAEKRQWTEQKVLQDKIIQQRLNEVNNTTNQYLEEINRLKEELRALKEKYDAA